MGKRHNFHLKFVLKSQLQTNMATYKTSILDEKVTNIPWNAKNQSHNIIQKSARSNNN